MSKLASGTTNRSSAKADSGSAMSAGSNVPQPVMRLTIRSSLEKRQNKSPFAQAQQVAPGHSTTVNLRVNAMLAQIARLSQQQWLRIKEYATQQGILLGGDLPVYAAHDPSDV